MWIIWSFICMMSIVMSETEYFTNQKKRKNTANSILPNLGCLWGHRHWQQMRKIFPPVQFHFNNSRLPSNLYVLPFSVVKATILSLYRSKQSLPARERISTDCSLPSLHFIFNWKPPLAQMPLISPSAKANGKAGRRSIYFVWLCTSISPMPAAPPKFPSIWNGGCASNKLW